MPSKDDYTVVRLPKEIMEEIDAIIRQKKRGYRSRAEFVKEALRMRLEGLKTTMPMLDLPSLEHFNLDEHGVRILDRTLATKTSNGRIIDVYFKPDKIWCDFDQTTDCKHTKFARELPEVQKILSQKGWTMKT